MRGYELPAFGLIANGGFLALWMWQGEIGMVALQGFGLGLSVAHGLMVWSERRP